jgi:hypothetical protein
MTVGSMEALSTAWQIRPNEFLRETPFHNFRCLPENRIPSKTGFPWQPLDAYYCLGWPCLSASFCSTAARRDETARSVIRPASRDFMRANGSRPHLSICRAIVFSSIARGLAIPVPVPVTLPTVRLRGLPLPLTLLCTLSSLRPSPQAPELHDAALTFSRHPLAPNPVAQPALLPRLLSLAHPFTPSSNTQVLRFLPLVLSASCILTSRLS